MRRVYGRLGRGGDSDLVQVLHNMTLEIEGSPRGACEGRCRAPAAPRDPPLQGEPPRSAWAARGEGEGLPSISRASPLEGLPSISRGSPLEGLPSISRASPLEGLPSIPAAPALAGELPARELAGELPRFLEAAQAPRRRRPRGA
jgi:hypothetical protein